MSIQTIALVAQQTLLDFVFVFLLGAVVGLLLVLLTRSKFLQGPPGPPGVQGPMGMMGGPGKPGTDCISMFGFNTMSSPSTSELVCVDNPYIPVCRSTMESLNITEDSLREMRVFGTLIGMSTKLRFLNGEHAQIFVTKEEPIGICACCGLTPQDAFDKSGKHTARLMHSDTNHATDVYLNVCGSCGVSTINVVCD